MEKLEIILLFVCIVLAAASISGFFFLNLDWRYSLFIFILIFPVLHFFAALKHGSCHACAEAGDEKGADQK